MKKLMIAIIACAALASCSKDLKEEPKSVAEEQFYNTAAEVETAVNAIFGPLRNESCMGGLYPAQLETYGEYIYGRGSYQPLNEYAGLDNTNITRSGQIWDLFYRAVRNANLVILNAPNGNAISEADIKKYVAEARFMRAFTYFHLVRNWGALPLRTESNMEEANLARSPEAAVYQLIKDDLQQAATDLPDAAAIAGRPTKWAARALLADVHITLNENTEAMTRADEVIASGKYALVPVATAAEFDKIYGADVVTSPEEIFYLKFSRSGSSQGWQMVMFAHHPGAKYHGAGGFYAHYTDTVQNSVIKNWDPADLRKPFNLYSYNIGLGATSVLFRKFKDPVAATQLSAGNDYPLYKYSDVLLLYAEAACKANSGPTALAVERLNMVRRRAYGLNPLVADAGDYKLADYDAAGFLNLVVKERGYETVYEAKRWLELKRMGIAKTVVQQVKGKTVADKHLLWPVPLSEMNYNKALDPVKDQNPGY
ncbi:RagB/SusD family nutrient uptake outer membrane protein [Chitinophaga sp.]|uniref:RagB/SusD family nutrient uptake outer membrane protein n=1 Tax=Chitinophaga sp. TaxID=1869181 RepID=UPI0031D9FC46